MKSRTSFFNFSILRKDLLRFSPLWGILLVISMLSKITDALFSGPELYVFELQSMPVGHFLFAFLCAVLLFGDLFNARAAGTLHAFPIRREGWFFTHSLAGILIYLLALGLSRLLILLTTPEFWYLELLTLGAEFGTFLFFFGLAAFCIQCTGTRLGALSIYVLINFLIPFLKYLAKALFSAHFYGIVFETEFLTLLCPIVSLTGRKFLEIKYYPFDPSTDFLDSRTEFQGLIGNDWWYLIAVVAIGLVFWGVALLLYRRRHIESAGSFITIRFMAFLFLILFTLLIGAICFPIGGYSYLFLLIGLGLGFFTALMLLEKHIKVFRKQTWFTLGVISLVLFSSLLLAQADPFGIVRYVPEPEDVSQVTMEIGYDVSSTDDGLSAFQKSEDRVVLDTPDELALLQTLHTDLIQEADNSSGFRSMELLLTYELKNGRVVTRLYPYPSKDALTRQLNRLMSQLDLFQTTDILQEVISISYEHDNMMEDVPNFQILAQPLKPGSFDPMMDIKILAPTRLNQDPTALALWEAMRKDCLEGNTAQAQDDYSASIGLLQITRLNKQGETETVSFRIYRECSHFLTFLSTLKSE